MVTRNRRQNIGWKYQEREGAIFFVSMPCVEIEKLPGDRVFVCQNCSLHCRPATSLHECCLLISCQSRNTASQPPVQPSIVEDANQCEAGPFYASTNEKISVTEDSESWKTWDKSLICHVRSHRSMVALLPGQLAYVAGMHPALKNCSTSAQLCLPIRLQTSSQNGSQRFLAR